MPVTSRTMWGVHHQINDCIRAVSQMLNKQLVFEGTNKPLDGSPLYACLFGDTAPISMSISCTREIAAIFQMMGNELERKATIGSLVEAPTLERKFCSLIVPLEYGLDRQKQCLVLPCSEPLLRIAYWTGSGTEHPQLGSVSFGTAVSPELLRLVKVSISKVYGPEVLAAIERMQSIRARLSDLAERTRTYAHNCVGSDGALYKKLPPLHTIAPRPKITHVSITRQAKDPDNDLLMDLNLLASLYTAAK